MNLSLNFLLFCIPPEIWRNHICLFLEREDLSNLRIACSYFRKEIIHSHPTWEQWIPSHELRAYEEVYTNLGWKGKNFAMIFGVYIVIQQTYTESLLDPTITPVTFPESLRYLDISKDPSTMYDLRIKSRIHLFPSSLEYICLCCSVKTQISEETLEAIYNWNPRILIEFNHSFHYSNHVMSVLHYVCMRGYSRIVRYLIKYHKEEVKVNINKTYIWRSITPLLDSILTGDVELVTLLLENGANPNIADDTGNTPLMDACFRQDIDIIQLLLKYGADKEKRDCRGKKALYYAIDPYSKTNIEGKIVELLSK